MADPRSNATSSASLSSEITLSALPTGVASRYVEPKIAVVEDQGVLPDEEDVPMLSDVRKTVLLAIFALSVFVDGAS